MSDRRIEISFDNVSAADANRFAQELETAVRSTEPSVAVNRAKPDSTTQDIGTIVGVVVTSGAALAIAQGIADWIRLRRASITIKENGEVVATGLTGDQSLRLVEILATRKNERRIAHSAIDASSRTGCGRLAGGGAGIV